MEAYRYLVLYFQLGRNSVREKRNFAERTKVLPTNEAKKKYFCEDINRLEYEIGCNLGLLIQELKSK